MKLWLALAWLVFCSVSLADEKTEKSDVWPPKRSELKDHKENTGACDIDFKVLRIKDRFCCVDKPELNPIVDRLEIETIYYFSRDEFKGVFQRTRWEGTWLDENGEIVRTAYRAEIPEPPVGTTDLIVRHDCYWLGEKFGGKKWFRDWYEGTQKRFDSKVERGADNKISSAPGKEKIETDLETWLRRCGIPFEKMLSKQVTIPLDAVPLKNPSPKEKKE